MANWKSFFSLKVCIFLDFFSVALILPFFPTYFRNAGLTTQQYGLIMSIYHLSQIVGGILMGSLADIYSKRNILIISFLGSFISYGIVGISSNLYLLFLSRIIVGVVKQTLTISSSIITSSTTQSTTSAELLSHLNAAKSLGFILGPSIGGILYKMNPSYPALVSSGIFLINILICYLTIPSSPNSSSSSPSTSSTSSPSTLSMKSSPTSALQYLQQLFVFLSQHHLFFPLCCPILLLFLDSISSQSAIPSYLELRYHIETSSLGYIFSFTSLVSFLCHSFMMKHMLHFTSHSIPNTIRFTLLLTMIAHLFEFLCFSHISPYLLIYIPLATLSSSIQHPLAKSFFLHSAPSQYSGTLLGIMNLTENAVSVLSPLYSGTLYGYWGYEKRGLLAFAHYSLGWILIWKILDNSEEKKEKEREKEREKKREKKREENTQLSDQRKKGQEEDKGKGKGKGKKEEEEILKEMEIIGTKSGSKVKID